MDYARKQVFNFKEGGDRLTQDIPEHAWNILYCSEDENYNIGVIFYKNGEILRVDSISKLVSVPEELYCNKEIYVIPLN